jgi:hypothetical protein
LLLLLLEVKSQSVFVTQSEFFLSNGVGPSWAQVGVRMGVGGHIGDFCGVVIFLPYEYRRWLEVSNADWSGSGRDVADPAEVLLVLLVFPATGEMSELTDI